MDKNPPKRKTMIEVQLENLKGQASPGCRWCYGRGYTEYNLKTDKHVLCRCVKRNRKAKQAAEAAPEAASAEPQTFNGFNEVQVGTIRRMRGEAELLDEKAKSAEVKVSGHPSKARLDEARDAVEGEQRAITARVNTAKERREMAKEDEVWIESYKKEAAQRKERARVLLLEAENLDTEAAKVERKSRAEGLQRAMSQLEKRVHRETHAEAKRGREAAKKAARIRAHLDSTYPGHGEVP